MLVTHVELILGQQREGLFASVGSLKPPSRESSSTRSLRSSTARAWARICSKRARISVARRHEQGRPGQLRVHGLAVRQPRPREPIRLLAQGGILARGGRER